MPTGAELFVDTLNDLGIRDLFTLVGDHLNDILLTAGQRGLRVIDMRHEAAVVHAADAWARIHRRPALALVTGGPGHTNALTGLATAHAAGSPVILVSGSRPSTQAGRGAFQEVEQLASAAPLCKWAAEARATAEIPELLRHAFAEATRGRFGPVHLTIPVDLLAATFTPGDFTQALALLQAAERPVVIAGSGVYWSEGAPAALRRFAEASQIPVFTISFGRGTLPDDHPLCFGYADPALNRTAAHALREADVALIVGKRIDFRLAMGKVFAPECQIVQVDIHPAEFSCNRPVAVAVLSDARGVLEALADDPGWPERSHYLASLLGKRSHWSGWLDAQAASPEQGGIHPAALFAELRKCLPFNTLYSWDGGDFVHWGRAMLPARASGEWLRLGPLGTIGAALPNAVALQLAHPDRPVAMITGDGALGFYIAELDSLVRHRLPVVIIVGNDAGWGLERELQGPGATVGCELRATRYDVVMQGFGGHGENITDLAELPGAVERAFARRDAPTLLNVNIRGVRSPFTRWKLGESVTEPRP